jgi:acetyl/propionyl-CoA carboxylase alpha subunit
MSRYVALLDGGKREVEIEVEEDGPGRYQVRLGGRLHRVDAFRHDFGTLSLLVDTASHTATFDERGALLRVRVGDTLVPLEIHAERRLRLRRAPGTLTVEGRQPVTAPLAGRVLRLLVAPGDRVTRGQPLLVLEALRMENELRSPRDGVVVELQVQPGQDVASGAPLLAVE